MSHFYGSIEGSRGPATRCGTKGSGIRGHLRGWHVGARVVVYHDEGTGLDCVEVYRTGGSIGGDPERLVAAWTELRDEPTKVMGTGEGRSVAMT